MERSIRYSKEVLEHFLRPKNAGVIDDPSGVGMIGDPDCGDSLQLFIRVEGDRITDVKYLIRGCPAAMAVASALSELAKGKPVEDALFITDDDVVEALGGLPEIKLHCSNLGASALQLALKDYYERRIKEG
jgi:nitrogen fixation protein NifU and related proteins